MDGARVVAQRYRLDEAVGVGGMGEVWRATDLELRRVVASKKSQTGDSAQIRREARIGAGLHHPHVVTVFDAVADGADRWLVMEYLPARDLATIVRTDGPLGPVPAARIVAQIADAVAAMHAKGMVHRDIKPGNVLVTEDGTAKLTDLGIARWAEVTHTGEAEMGGTPGYLAPEVANGAETDARADVFALGATLFAATTGRSPWGGPELGPHPQLHRAREYQLEPLPDNGLQPPLQAMLARDPAARPTATQAHHGLTAMVGDSVSPIAPLGSGTEPTPSPPPASAGLSRRGCLAAGLGFLAVALLLTGTVFALRPPHETGQATPVPLADPVGDPHTFDPCSVLSADELSRYGKVAVERDYGNFTRCSLLTKLPTADSPAETSVEFGGLNRDDVPDAQPGKFSTGTPEEKDGECRRYIVTPASTQLTIATKVINDNENKVNAPLCGMSQRIMTFALATLSSAPLPRLQPPHPANSTALVDACTLLTAQDLTPVLGSAPPPAAGFGAWSCEYGDEGDKQVDIEFGREWQLDNPDPDIGSEDKHVALAGKTGYENTDAADEGTCAITFSHRQYTIKDPAFDGPPIRDETVVVTLNVPGAADIAPVCADTVKLANAVIAHLPG